MKPALASPYEPGIALPLPLSSPPLPAAALPSEIFLFLLEVVPLEFDGAELGASGGKCRSPWRVDVSCIKQGVDCELLAVVEEGCCVLGVGAGRSLRWPEVFF